MAHEGYHEPIEELSESTRNMHRALVSLQEELEAVDWYYQRAASTKDESLRAILLHNAHEEIEHAMMALEWIRRGDHVFDRHMRTYLFREGSIVAAEAEATGKTTAEPAASEPVPRRAPPTSPTSLGSLRDDRRAR